jgi:hypothetical protein
LARALSGNSPFANLKTPGAVQSWQESCRKPQIEFVAKSLILRLRHVLTSNRVKLLSEAQNLWPCSILVGNSVQIAGLVTAYLALAAARSAHSVLAAVLAMVVGWILPP